MNVRPAEGWSRFEPVNLSFDPRRSLHDWNG